MSGDTQLFRGVRSVGFRGRVDLAGAAEVAAMLGVTRQQVDRLAQRPDFPKPIANLKMGRIWRKRDIERWMRAHPHRRPGPPPKPYPPR